MSSSQLSLKGVWGGRGGKEEEEEEQGRKEGVIVTKLTQEVRAGTSVQELEFRVSSFGFGGTVNSRFRVFVASTRACGCLSGIVASGHARTHARTHKTTRTHLHKQLFARMNQKISSE